MRIAVVSTSTLGTTAANVVHAVQMSRAFAELGHRVLLFAGSVGAGDTRDGERSGQLFGGTLDVRVVTGGSHLAVVSQRRARHHLRNLTSVVPLLASGADLVYGRNLPLLLTAATGMRTQLVPEFHDIPRSGTHAGLVARLLRNPKVACTVFISRALMSSYLASHWASDACSPFVLPLAGPEPAPASATEAIPPDPSTPRVGYFGSLHRGKGVELLVDAAVKLPHIEMHVFGGRCSDLRRFAGAPQNVIFHGHLPHERTQAEMRRMTALVAPYAEHVAVDGGGGDVGRWMSPLKLFEYLAAGRPVIVSDLPVIREIVGPDDVRFMRPGDVASLVEALGAVLASAAYRRTLARNGLRIAARHTWRSRAQSILSRTSGAAA